MKTIIKVIRKFFRISFILLISVLVMIILSNSCVKRSSKNRIYQSTEKIPYNKVGLLLGTSKRLSNGNLNLYYKYRIEAAVSLFYAKKIDFILVSGDNSQKEYNEPATIKADLIAKGIPAGRIFLDYAGFRTLDSVIRSKEIFGLTNLTVISQQFHNERAIFIALRKEIEAIGFNAKDVSKNYGLKVQIREKFARVKMMIDLIFRKKPKFLGERIEIK